MNWKRLGGPGWESCPHCDPNYRWIHLPKEVRGDWPFGQDIVAPAGNYQAEFNPQGAAMVTAANGKLGVKPAEFRWLRPVPPYDRWCKGKGGLHQ